MPRFRLVHMVNPRSIALLRASAHRPSAALAEAVMRIGEGGHNDRSLGNLLHSLSCRAIACCCLGWLDIVTDCRFWDNRSLIRGEEGVRTSAWPYSYLD
eukprot:6205155-Pleurochrysis_carterae.AAC.2